MLRVRNNEKQFGTSHMHIATIAGGVLHNVLWNKWCPADLGILASDLFGGVVASRYAGSTKGLRSSAQQSKDHGTLHGQR